MALDGPEPPYHAPVIVVRRRRQMSAAVSATDRDTEVGRANLEVSASEAKPGKVDGKVRNVISDHSRHQRQDPPEDLPQSLPFQWISPLSHRSGQHARKDGAGRGWRLSSGVNGRNHRSQRLLPAQRQTREGRFGWHGCQCVACRPTATAHGTADHPLGNGGFEPGRAWSVPGHSVRGSSSGRPARFWSCSSSTRSPTLPRPILWSVGLSGRSLW